MLLVCTFGLVGNIAGIITFGRPRLLQKNFYDFMFYLSIFDLIYVIVSLFVFVFPHFSNYYRDNGPFRIKFYYLHTQILMLIEWNCKSGRWI